MVWNYYFISARWLPPLRINKVKVKVYLFAIHFQTEDAFETCQISERMNLKILLLVTDHEFRTLALITNA